MNSEHELPSRIMPETAPAPSRPYKRMVVIVGIILAIIVAAGIVYAVVTNKKSLIAKETAFRQEYEAVQVKSAQDFFAEHPPQSDQTAADIKKSQAFFAKYRSQTKPSEASLNATQDMSAKMQVLADEQYQAWKKSQ